MTAGSPTAVTVVAGKTGSKRPPPKGAAARKGGKAPAQKSRAKAIEGGDAAKGRAARRTR